jgi:Flp pilus assembly protein TadB
MRQTPEQEAEYEILRKVLWDEPKESVLKEAQMSGLTSKKALAFYDKACQKRAQSIRRRGLKESLLGVLGLLVAVGVFAFYWFVIGGFTRVMLFWVAVLFTFGVFNLIRGLDRYFMPHWKRGSIACDP